MNSTSLSLAERNNRLGRFKINHHLEFGRKLHVVPGYSNPRKFGGGSNVAEPKHWRHVVLLNGVIARLAPKKFSLNVN
jgi:hypothetical protein